MSRNDKIKILFIITQSEWGGAQQFIYQLITGLDPGVFEVILATGHDGDGDLIQRLPHIQHTIIPSLVRTQHLFQDIKSVFAIRSLIESVRPDILFLNSSKAGFNGSLAAQLLPKSQRPVVFYRIGGWTFNDPWPLLKKLYFFILEWLSARWKDHIITNSSHDYQQAVRYHIRPRKHLHLIYNGIDVSKLTFYERDQARTMLAPHMPSADAFWLGVIANFYPAKGLTYFLESISELQKNIREPVKAIIIGDGSQRQLLEHYIAVHNLQNIVRLAGKIPDAYRYLKAFDVFVVPSVKEGFPWVVLEAMAAGVSIIATSVGAIPEIIQDGENGVLIPPKNINVLTQSIIDLMQDRSLREKLAQTAQRSLATLFSKDKMIEAFTRLFQSSISDQH